MTNEQLKALEQSSYYEFFSRDKSDNNPVGKLIIETENAVDRFYVTDFNAVQKVEFDPSKIEKAVEFESPTLLFKDRTSDTIDIEIGTSKWKHFNIKGGNILEVFNITTQTRNYEVSVRILHSGGDGRKFTLQLPSNNLPYNILAEVSNLSSITNIIIGIRPVINHKKEDLYQQVQIVQISKMYFFI